MTSKQKLTVIDLFAGCGGLSLGLEQAGFTPLFVNELNPHAMDTYLANRVGHHPHLAEKGFHANDVKMMVNTPNFLPELVGRLRDTFGVGHGEVDLVVGGPPCQGFSGIGHRRSYSVDKENLPSNHLFQDMAYVVQKVQPRGFLFENVRGLLNAKWNDGGENGDIFRAVLKAFSSLKGYRVGWSLVLAKGYGVPQNRPRVLLVGLRDDVIVKGEDQGTEDAVKRGFLPKPGLLVPPTLPELLGDLEVPDYVNGGSTDFYPTDPLTAAQTSLRTEWSGHVRMKGEELTEQEYSKHAPRIVAKFAAMLADPNHEIPLAMRTKKFSQKVLPAVWPAGGPTITATSMPDDYVHYSLPRVLTVREWARLQMFPDWYTFKGKRTTGGIRRAGNPRDGNFDREVPKYTQIGNAVPVGLAKAVGQHLASILGTNES